MRIVMLSDQRGAEDGFTLKDFREGVEYDLTRTPRARELAVIFVNAKLAREVDVLPVCRLPLEPEYRRAGYTGDYAAFIAARTAEATASGKRVEVRDLTAAELATEEAERRRLFADEGTLSTAPDAPPAGVANLAAVLNIPAEIPPTLAAVSAPLPDPPPTVAPARPAAQPKAKKNRG